MEYLISLVLIVLSALFSGLTLGLFTLDPQALKRRSESGDTNAAKIYPIRKHGNQLLTTLLLGNVAVNTALSIFLGSVASGLVAGIIATAAIFIFGEIIPQAVISRHALYFGAKTAPFVRIIMYLLYPITFPIAYLLDRALGEELPTVYSKNELMQIVSEHEDSEHSGIDEDEERIIHGALQFSHIKTHEVMTPLDQIVMFEVGQKLTDDFYETVTEAGYSRYPVYSGKRENIVGILFAKDLLTEEDDIAIKSTEEAFEDHFMTVGRHELLDTVLTKMLTARKHMAVVYNRNNHAVGVITMEDIIEEIIQAEIEDEDDEDRLQQSN